MLFHLILWTPEGRLLIGRSKLVHLREDADALRGRAEFDKVAELWSPALAEAMAGGERNAFAIAFCHERLGYAHSSLHDWPAAETEFRKCLGHRAECAFETAFLVNALSGLQRASLQRHHPVEVGLAYAPALAALEKRRNNGDRVSRSVLGVMLARAHFCAQTFDKALQEAGHRTADSPSGSRQDLTAGRSILHSGGIATSPGSDRGGARLRCRGQRNAAVFRHSAGEAQHGVERFSGLRGGIVDRR